MRRVLLITLSMAVGGLAQEAASKKPEFEVATIKPVETPKGSRTVFLDLNHGTAKVEYATLRQLIVQAYAIQRMRVMGGPDWFDRDQYDLAAKAVNPEATKDEVRLMLQALLADRFKLTVHRETREIPEYVLSVAKGGPHLQEAKPDEAAKNTLIGPGRLRFEDSKIVGLVNTLSNMLRAPVEDATGLTGSYDFTLDSAAAIRNRMSDGGANGSAMRPDPRDYLPGAVEKLGLKLQGKKGSMEVLIVDHAERPSPN